jgi:hypothetical protein
MVISAVAKASAVAQSEAITLADKTEEGTARPVKGLIV